MKTFSYLLILSSVFVVMISCRDEDRIRIPEAGTAANMRLVIDPAHASINYLTVATDYIAIDAYSENKDLDKVEFTVQYKDQIKIPYTLSQSDFASGKASLVFDANDFAEMFGVPGFADGSRGGNFAFRPIVYLTDGRVYPSYVVVSAQDSFLNVGTGPTGAANGAFTFRLNTSITCETVDISGSYVVISAIGQSTDGCCPDEVSLSGDIVEVSGTTDPAIFSVSDITGGLYLAWYEVYGITSHEDTPGTVFYNCNEVSIVNTGEPFGTAINGDGPYDPSTSRITYFWSNGYADSGTVILEKQ